MSSGFTVGAARTSLLQAGADPDRADSYGRTPRTIAIARGEEDLILLLDGRMPEQGPRTPAFASWLGTGLDAQVPAGSSLSAPRVGSRAANGVAAPAASRVSGVGVPSRAWTPLSASGALLAVSATGNPAGAGPIGADAAGRARLGSAARAALSTSRKFIVPALEFLDSRGDTTRKGDVRQVAAPRNRFGPAPVPH